MGLLSLYLAWGNSFGLVFLSPDPAFDSAFIQRLYGCGGFSLLTHPLPAGIASVVYHRLEERFFLRAAEPLGLGSLERLKEFCFRELASLRRYAPKQISPPPVPEDFGCKAGGFGDGELGEVEAVLTGRLLSPLEIGRALRLGGEAGRVRLRRLLQALCLTGRAAVLPALVPVKGGGVRCQRCGWEGVPRFQSCRGCGSGFCCTCPECQIMGGVSLCTPLYTAPAPPRVAAKSPDCVRVSSLWRRVLSPLLPKGRGVEASDIVCVPVVWGGAATPEAASPLAAGPKKDASGGGYRLDHDFTPAQEKAVAALRRFAEDSPAGSTCLVWAACGAGKTEVAFPVIGDALALGKKVLYATPRRDVVIENSRRLRKAFGSSGVVALYGGCGESGGSALLVAATAHQALRFYRCFDLVILDECDAYPYPESRMLGYAVRRAMRPEGKLIYLTATPADWMLDGKGEKIVDIIKIPARPHGFPLPEPRFLKVAPLRAKRGGGLELHEEVLELIAAILRRCGGGVLVFVPSVELAKAVGKALRAAAGKPPLGGLPPEGVQWSYAADLRRDEKRDGFLKKEFAVFVTTTIMERGLTFPRVHVVVLEADSSAVFDRAALVQMAGRCGRSPEYPTGEVWFVARSITREMEEARAEICGFNREALAAGYLRHDYESRLKEILKDGG